MKFHVVAEVNGEDRVFIVEADSEVEAQNAVYYDLTASIQMKTCSPWIEDDE